MPAARAITWKDFRGEKRNSPVEWEMDSNPTKAHGRSAATCRIWVVYDSLSGTNQGFTPSPSLLKIVPKQVQQKKRIPPNSTMAISVCIAAASDRLRMQMKPHSRTTAMETMASPK